MANGFVSTSGFSLPDEVLRKLRRSAFLTGTAVGPETTRASIEGALNVGAERESRFAQVAEDRRFREESLAQQESQFERSRALQESQFERNQVFGREQLAFQESEAEKARKSAFKGGIAEAATTVAGFGILKFFNII